MITYEDVTSYFLRAAANLGLVVHPEYWMNSHSLEREFACTCHTGNCEEIEKGSSCTVSFTWSTIDTALSLEGPSGVCDFFHDPDDQCPHLHTSDIPPLVLDLSYNLPLNGTGTHVSDATLLSFIQMLKLRASEHSSRAIETRPGVSMVLSENRLQAEALTLQQRVELPIWHPDGMHGLHDDPHLHQRFFTMHHHHLNEYEDHDEPVERGADTPRPEEWLPQVMVEVCQDIMRVLAALDSIRTHQDI